MVKNILEKEMLDSHLNTLDALLTEYRLPKIAYSDHTDDLAQDIQSIIEKLSDWELGAARVPLETDPIEISGDSQETDRITGLLDALEHYVDYKRKRLYKGYNPDEDEVYSQLCLLSIKLSDIENPEPCSEIPPISTFSAEDLERLNSLLEKLSLPTLCLEDGFVDLTNKLESINKALENALSDSEATYTVATDEHTDDNDEEEIIILLDQYVNYRRSQILDQCEDTQVVKLYDTLETLGQALMKIQDIDDSYPESEPLTPRSALLEWSHTEPETQLSHNESEAQLSHTEPEALGSDNLMAIINADQYKDTICETAQTIFGLAEENDDLIILLQAKFENKSLDDALQAREFCEELKENATKNQQEDLLDQMSAILDSWPATGASP